MITKRSFRITMALATAFAFTGVYLHDPDTCWDCTTKASPLWAVAIFVVTSLVSLRVLKRMSDIVRGNGR